MSDINITILDLMYRHCLGIYLNHIDVSELVVITYSCIRRGGLFIITTTCKLPSPLWHYNLDNHDATPITANISIKKRTHECYACKQLVNQSSTLFLKVPLRGVWPFCFVELRCFGCYYSPVSSIICSLSTLVSILRYLWPDRLHT